MILWMHYAYVCTLTRATFWNMLLQQNANLNRRKETIKCRGNTNYSLISMRLIYYFDTWAIIWHGIVPVFLKICTDLQEICSICSQNCFCYCFWTTLLQKQHQKQFCEQMLQISCKSSEILEHLPCQMMAQVSK